MDIIQILSEELEISKKQIENTVALIDEGNTIPFIARYRKEVTGGLDDTVLRKLGKRLEYLRNLAEKKEDVIRIITEQGKMTDEIMVALASAETLTEAEDIYRPFKPKRKTRASVAIAKGLQGLADYILAQNDNIEKEAEKYLDEEKEVKSVEEAIQGAKDIIAEMMSDNPEIRKSLKKYLVHRGEIKSELGVGENAYIYQIKKENI